jgi:hypothetical protein
VANILSSSRFLRVAKQTHASDIVVTTGFTSSQVPFLLIRAGAVRAVGLLVVKTRPTMTQPFTARHALHSLRNSQRSHCWTRNAITNFSIVCNKIDALSDFRGGVIVGRDFSMMVLARRKGALGSSSHPQGVSAKIVPQLSLP